MLVPSTDLLSYIMVDSELTDEEIEKGFATLPEV